MKDTERSPLATLVTATAAAVMPRPLDNPATPILKRHDVEIEYYAPKGSDAQTPHDRDELYVIATGRGYFVTGDERRHCSTGDLIFVAAGIAHRFEDFSDDFSTWVVFFGPQQ
jgi:mannose-6-phosphate isomerase-like protein (cupin superfamily)